MKSNLKKKLKALLIKVATELEPSFEVDPTFEKDCQLAVVRRRVSEKHWQFVALSFSTIGERFFVELAYSPNASFPVDRIPLGPDVEPTNGVLRFRVSSLWCHPNQSGGWLIWKPGNEPASDSVAKPEGVFETPEAAMEDVKERIKKWVLPYLDKVGKCGNQ